MFTSARERKLWLWALAVVLAIYATLGATPYVAASLRERDLLAGLWGLGLLAVVIVIGVVAVSRRPRAIEVALGTGVIAVYGMVLARFRSSEERSHLFEYGVVALLVYEALSERRRNGGHVSAPALLAIAIAALVGTADELIQAVLPNRVFDTIDITFNSLAALMAVGTAAAFAWVRRRRSTG